MPFQIVHTFVYPDGTQFHWTDWDTGEIGKKRIPLLQRSSRWFVPVHSLTEQRELLELLQHIMLMLMDPDVKGFPHDPARDAVSLRSEVIGIRSQTPCAEWATIFVPDSDRRLYLSVYARELLRVKNELKEWESRQIRDNRHWTGEHR